MQIKTRDRLKKGIYIIAAVVFWIAVWQIAAMRIGTEFYLPSPLAVFRSFKTLLPQRSFWITVGRSLLRVAQGYLPGVLIGFVAGIIAAKVRFLDILCSPLLSVIRATPVSSFIMLALVCLGRETTPSFIVFLMVLPIVWANVAEGIRTVDRSLLEVCRVYQMPAGRVLKILYLPHCLPYFSAGVLTSLGLAWKAGIAAEVLCTPKYSIGKMVYDAKVYLETADLFAWTLTVIVFSILLETLLKSLLKRGKRR